MQVHTAGLDSICYPVTTSKRLRSFCYGAPMTPDELQTFRAKRLDALVEKLGSNNELGRQLGMSNGTFIGQMRRGERAITEKFIAKVEASIRGTKGWFSPQNLPQNTAAGVGEEIATFSHNGDKLTSSLLYLGEQLEGLDDYKRNAVGQLLLGLSKKPEDALKIATDIKALINSRGKMVA